MRLKKYKLGDVLDVTRGASLGGEFYATEGKYIRLTCGNFDYQNNCFKENKSKDNLYYVGDFKPEFLMKEGDIITPLTEQAIGLLGSTAVIPESGKYIQSQDVARISCNEEMLDKDFAFYLISSNLVKQQLSAAAQQTKIRHTSPDKIKDCTVWVPELAEQKRIGKLLRSLDHKIELNRAINQNLEAMAKQLYDYWFVQFDFPNEEGKPYKSSGGAMNRNKELGYDIPVNWGVESLNSWLEIKSGFAFQSSTYSSTGKYKVVTIKNVQDRHLDISTCDCVEDIPTGMKDWCELSVGDYLISLTGNCGRLCVVTEEKLLLNQRVGLLSCKDMLRNYAYMLLSSERMQAICQNLAKGAAQANLSPIDLCKTNDIVPPADVIKRFENAISPIITSYIQHEKEIVVLTKQRDELLPLLMNGQVSVNSDLSHG